VEGPFARVTIFWAALNPMPMPQIRTPIATQTIFRSSRSLSLKTATFLGSFVGRYRRIFDDFGGRHVARVLGRNYRRLRACKPAPELAPILAWSIMTAWISCSGRGGQPGTKTSTGIT
jgi:hypothetical protein